MLFGKHVNKYYLKYFWYFFFGIAFLILVDWVQLKVPETIGNLSSAIEKGQITSFHDELLLESIFTIFAVALCMFVGRFAWRRCILGESIRIQADLRQEMFLKTEVLSQRFYKENKTGAILAYFSNDLETIEEVFGFGIVQLVDGIFLGVLASSKCSK